MILFFTATGYGEEVHSAEERQRVLNQLQFLAGSLKGMPRVPEMHHTIILPEPESNNTETIIENKETD